MSYNGSGTFNINSTGQPVVTGTVISSTAFNALTADLATGLSTALTKDGQTTPTANIPMGAFKITGLGDGTAGTDAVTLSQLQNSASSYLSVSGTDTIAATLSPALTAYATGQIFTFVPANTNTSATTINISSLGAKSITKSGSTALVAGDLVVNRIALIEYDGTQFQLLNPNAPNAGSFTSITDSGNLTFTGTGNRITGDFSNATLANRVAIQTSTVNGNTGIFVLPNGTATTANIQLSNNSDPTNASVATLGAVSTTEIRLTSGIQGTGTYLPMTFYTGGSERVRIDTSGNVFVAGTSAPVLGYEKFGVYGSAGIKTSSATALGVWNTTSSGMIGFYTGAGTPAGSISASGADLSIAGGGALSLGAAGANVMTFSTNSSERMRIDTSGNVGIATTTPYSQLDVYSAIVSPTTGEATGVGSIRITNNASALSSASGLEFKIAGDSNGYGVKIQTISSGGAQLVFANRQGSATWTERMRIDSSGNVGIGTSSPSSKLHVYTSSAAQINGLIQNSVSYLNYGVFADGNNYVYSGTATNLLLGTNNTERMRIDANGKITDQYGNIRAVPQSGAAKTASYTLVTTDVGQYIQISTSGAIVIPNSTFAAGDVISVFNNTSANATITCSTTNAYIAGIDTNKTSVTLATRGVATILFITSTLCVISGNVS